MDSCISSSIDNNIPATHYQLFGVDMDLAEQLRCLVGGHPEYAWLNIPVVDGDSEPSLYSMALAEELGCRLYGVLSQISQAELDIFHGWYNHQDHDDHHHQPPTITEVVKATSSQETAAVPQVPEEEEEEEEREEAEENTTAVMKEDDEEEILEEEDEKEEEMMAYYKTDQMLHEQLMRKHYYPKYSRKSCRSSRKRSSK